MRSTLRSIVEVSNALAICFFAGGCATSNDRHVEEWRRLKASEEFTAEKSVFSQRLGGKEFCWSNGVDEFLTSSSVTLKPTCVYPSSQLIVDESGILSDQKALRQAPKQLKVLQIIAEGYVVKSPNYLNDAVIFIHKTDEVDVVDGSYLDATNWQVYEYTGPFVYRTLVGSRTVHSFKKLSKDRIAMLKTGLKRYDPLQEFMIEHGLWQYLGERGPNPAR